MMIMKMLMMAIMVAMVLMMMVVVIVMMIMMKDRSEHKRQQIGEKRHRGRTKEFFKLGT